VNSADADSGEISKVWFEPSRCNFSIGRPDSAVAAVQGLLHAQLDCVVCSAIANRLVRPPCHR